MRRELRAEWPSLDPELTLLHWLCERHNLKPPQGSLRSKPPSAITSPRSEAGESSPSHLAAAALPPISPPFSPRAPAPAPFVGATAPLPVPSTIRTLAPPVLQPMQPPQPLQPLAEESSLRRLCSSDSQASYASSTGLRSLEAVSHKLEMEKCNIASKLQHVRSGNEKISCVKANMKHEHRGKFLAKVPLLSPEVLSHQERVMLVGKLRPQNFAAGSFIVREGEVGHELFIIEQGTCEVMRGGGASSSEPEKHMCDISREDFFGELAMMYARPRAATVRAKTMATVLSLSHDDLLSAIGTDRMEQMMVIARSRCFSSIPLLSLLTTKQKLHVTERLQAQTWPAGSLLCMQNARVVESTRLMRIIEEGHCRMEVKNALDGTITVTDLVPGQYFGMLSMFYASPASVTVFAETEVTTLSLGHAELLEICCSGVEGPQIERCIKRAMRCHLVRQVPQLSALRDELLEVIIENSEEVRFKKWDVLFSKGSRVDMVYILEEGTLAEHDGDIMSLKEEDLQGGTQAQTCWEHMLPGETFGVDCLKDGRATASTTLVACTDVTVLRITGVILRSVLNQEVPRDMPEVQSGNFLL